MFICVTINMCLDIFTDKHGTCKNAKYCNEPFLHTLIINHQAKNILSKVHSNLLKPNYTELSHPITTPLS